MIPAAQFGPLFSSIPSSPPIFLSCCSSLLLVTPAPPTHRFQVSIAPGKHLAHHLLRLFLAHLPHQLNRAGRLGFDTGSMTLKERTAVPHEPRYRAEAVSKVGSPHLKYHLEKAGGKELHLGACKVAQVGPINPGSAVVKHVNQFMGQDLSHPIQVPTLVRTYHNLDGWCQSTYNPPKCKPD